MLAQFWPRRSLPSPWLRRKVKTVSRPPIQTRPRRRVSPTARPPGARQRKTAYNKIAQAEASRRRRTGLLRLVPAPGDPAAGRADPPAVHKIAMPPPAATRIPEERGAKAADEPTSTKVPALSQRMARALPDLAVPVGELVGPTPAPQEVPLPPPVVHQVRVPRLGGEHRRAKVPKSQDPVNPPQAARVRSRAPAVPPRRVHRAESDRPAVAVGLRAEVVDKTRLLPRTLDVQAISGSRCRVGGPSGEVEADKLSGRTNRARSLASNATGSRMEESR